MINRYDLPAQASFINTYSPVPFDDILKAGLTKQGRADANRMGFEQSVADSQNLDYMPNSEDQNYVLGLRTKLEEIRDSYIDRDYDNPEVVRQIYSDIRRNVNKDRLDKIQRSAKGYREYQQQAAKSKAEGRSLFEEFDPTGYDSQTGIFNMQPEALHNYAEKKRQYFNDRETDVYTDPKTGRMYEYRNANLLNKITADSVEDYAKSTEGSQEIRGRRKAGDNRSDKEIAYDLLQDASEEFKTHKYRGMDPMFKSSGSDEDSRPQIDNASNTQSLRNENRISEDEVKSSLGFNPTKINTTTDLLDKLSFDSNGMLTSEPVSRALFAGEGIKAEFNAAKKAGKTTAKDAWEYKQQANQKEKDTEYRKIKSQVDNIRKLNPTLAQNKDGRPASDVQLLEAYSKAYKNLENQDYNTYLYETYKVSESAKARNNRQIIEDIPGRKIRIAESGKLSGKPVSSLEDLYDELDIPAEDRKSENLSITGVAPSLNAYKAIINSSKGMKSFLISTSRAEQNMFNLVEKATQLSSKAKVGEEKFQLNGKDYIVTTRVEDNQGNYEFTSNIRTSDGSELIPGVGKSQMGMDAFEDYTVSNFMINL